MLSALLVLALLSLPSNLLAEGTIQGYVVASDDLRPLPYANVMVVNTPHTVIANLDGRFSIVLPAGRYKLSASLIGYLPKELEDVAVDSGVVLNVTIKLTARVLKLSAITVTPGRFSIMQSDPAGQQTLTREDIESIPQTGEDIYRAVARLPGISSNDFSAKFTVRGGEHEEVLVSLDGLKLFDPFHLKDINGGSLSIIDVKAVGGIDLMTGGFPSQHGGHLSGVLKIASIDPKPEPQTTVGISLMTVRFLTEGQFGDGKLKWLLSARRGYLDIVLDLMNETGADPKYYDVFGKLETALGDAHTLTTSVMGAGDDMFAQEEEDTARTRYDNAYVWQRLNSTFGQKIAAETVWSFSRISHDRIGTNVSVRPVSTSGGAQYSQEQRWHVEDERIFTILGLQQDWYVDVGGHFLSAGFDAKKLDADYDYFNRERLATRTTEVGVISVYDTTLVSVSPEGYEIGLYLSDRFRVASSVTAEIGVRLDRISYTDDWDLSPRASVVYTRTSGSAIRASWGLYHQSQGIHEMDVANGEQVFYRSERSQHRVVGIEHVFPGGLQLRVEGYQKRRSHVRPRWENYSKDVLFFPELEAQKLFLAPESAESKGIEVCLKRDVGTRWSFWSSYSTAWSNESIGGRDVPRNTDQRHTIYMDANYRPSARWRINLAWQFHTGWPYTAEHFIRRPTSGGRYRITTQYGERNAKRFPAYHRLDLRVNRVFNTSTGRLSVFAEVVNLYNQENLRLIEASRSGVDSNGNLIVAETLTEKWLPLLPSIGASWTF